MRAEIVPIEREHVDHVAANMRAGDVAEVWASNRYTPLRALQVGARSSLLGRTGLVDGVPVCIFGVSPAGLLTGHGTPWMLSTPGLLRAAKPVARLSLPVVECMQAIFPTLVNYVDNRNRAAIRWLGWLGFQVEEPRPYGPDGLPFCRFSRSR